MYMKTSVGNNLPNSLTVSAHKGTCKFYSHLLEDHVLHHMLCHQLKLAVKIFNLDHIIGHCLTKYLYNRCNLLSIMNF